MFNLFKWLFGTEDIKSTFNNLAMGDEFKYLDSMYVKTSHNAYCESKPVNSYTSLKWRIVNEDFAVQKIG